jgi:hypothetical protein
MSLRDRWRFVGQGTTLLKLLDLPAGVVLTTEVTLTGYRFIGSREPGPFAFLGLEAALPVPRFSFAVGDGYDAYQVFNIDVDD